MNKKTKIWIAVGICLILAGCMIMAGTLAFLKWELKDLSSEEYETNIYEPEGVFSSIRIRTDTASVFFAPSENGRCSVECYEEINSKHKVDIKNGVLTVELEETKKWYEHIGINFSSPKITLYLPVNEYTDLTVNSSTGKVDVAEDFKFQNICISLTTGAVICRADVTGPMKISASTGSITLEDLSAGSVELTASTGAIKISNLNCLGDIKTRVTTGKTQLDSVRCENFISDGDTGALILSDVVARGRFDIERDTGDVRFDACDAGEIYVETDTGDVEGSLLSNKRFFTETDTGKVRVPASFEGGRCEISTDTGDVNITLK